MFYTIFLIMKLHCEISKKNGMTIFFGILCIMMITAYPSQMQFGLELYSITKANSLIMAANAESDGDSGSDSGGGDSGGGDSGGGGRGHRPLRSVVLSTRVPDSW